jgi:uracil-DNA glycosylase family 4
VGSAAIAPATFTRVVNRRNKGARYDGYVGRPSPYGNPYSIDDGTRAQYKVRTLEEALRKYELWLRNQPALIERARREYRGKTIACWCVDDDRRNDMPIVCHAQILARIIDEAPAIPTTSLVARAMPVYDPQALGAKCTECPLQGRHRPVPMQKPAGGKVPKLIIIGEGPGRVEIQTGIPFKGPSGQMLDKMLAKAGFDRSNAYVTNSASCMGDSDSEKERASACCALRMATELEALDPAIPILTLGAAAQRIFTGKRSIMRTRGFVWKLPEIPHSRVTGAARNLVNRKKMDPVKFAAAIDRAEQSYWRAEAREKLSGRMVIPSIHPAFVLRGGEASLPMLRVDIARAVRAANLNLVMCDPGDYVVAETVAELERQLKRLRTKEIVIDVETLGPNPHTDEMTMLGISEVPDVSGSGLESIAAEKMGKVGPDDLRVVLASPKPGETAATRAKAQRTLRAMCAALNRFVQTRTIVGHNLASFDHIVLARYGVHLKKIEDSLLAHHAFASHLRQGLDHVASMYLDIGPWKIDFKQRGAEEKGGLAPSRFMQGEALDRYNSLDVKASAIAWRRMQPDLESERRVYENDKALASVCRSMAVTGFYFDDNLATELSRQLRFRASNLLGQMRTVVGKRDFHPARPTDLRAALFGTLKVKPIAITATGLASTASRTLEAIKSPDTSAGKLADLILRWRACHKTRATFVEGVEPLADGRIHPSWKAFGTTSGRLSCRGPNLQNLPRWSRALEDRVRELYLAAPGHVLIYFDLSQSEMRMAAYLSDDEKFIESCEKGDVHSNNAKILFPHAREPLTRDPKGKNCPRHGEEGDSKAACNCGKDFRDVAKNAGFGILYQADFETIYKFLLSKGFDVTLPDVEAMFNEIHRVYARYYAFCDENMMFCKQHGYLREFFSSRIRWLGFFPSITDVSNVPVQGGIAGVMNDRIVKLYNRLPQGSRIVAQIHDAVIIEAEGHIEKAPKMGDDGKPVLGKDGKPVMKNVLCGTAAKGAMDVVKSIWEEPIVTPTSGRKWVMPIDLKFGIRWSDFG